jgi:hypothetical protein
MKLLEFRNRFEEHHAADHQRIIKVKIANKYGFVKQIDYEIPNQAKTNLSVLSTE